jgi:hypothetical protein
MSDLRDRARFKEQLEEISSAFRASLMSASPAYVGADFAEPLEHVTRRHVIDIFLTALGWTLNQHGHDILEEAQVKGEATLFLDYLGVNPRSRAPLLIVEAKAWAKPFASPSAASIERYRPTTKKDSDASLIARAVDHVKNGGAESSSPVSVEWARWIAKLHDYVRTVRQNSGYCVQRVAITSGQWIVIFCDPIAAFLQEGGVSETSILCFRDDKLIAQSDEIHDWLARGSLIRHPPEPLRPAQLTAYIDASNVVNAFRALWIVRRVDGAHFDVHPQLTVYVALVIQRRDGVLITAVDDGQRLIVPHENIELGRHIEDVAGSAEKLLQSVNRELDTSIVPSGIEVFPGFGRLLEQSVTPNVRPTPPQTQIDLLKPWQPRPNEFLLVTGVHPHFLHMRPTIENCRFHDWSACHSVGDHQGAGPIAVRSVNPRSFFRSTEDHHCAHRQVHDRRQTRCQIDAFEEFLCCRACTLQTFCWSPADIARLPCGSQA